MTRQISFTTTLLLLLFLCGTTAFAQGTKALPMDRYFPFYTVEYTSIPDMKRLADQFDKTDIGILASKPEMKSFRDSFRSQLASKSRLQERLGITLADLRNVAGGEVAFGIVYPNKDLLAITLMADITNHSAEANQLVNKVCAQAEQKGGKVVRQKVGTAEFIQLDVQDKNSVARKIVYVIDGSFMIISDNLAIAKLLWQKVTNVPAAASVKPLAFNLYYQQICKQSQVNGPREVFEFIQIDKYAEALNILNSKYSSSKLARKSPAEDMKASGLTGFRATGCSYLLKPEGTVYDRFARGYIYAPNTPEMPWEKSMNAFKLDNVPCPEPPAWVGVNTSMFAVAQSTPSAIYENIGPLVDTYFGQGEEGVWKDFVAGIEKDPMGPKVDLQNALIRYLDGQIIFVSTVMEPFTDDSERVAYVVKVKDTEAVRNALIRIFKDDPTVKPFKLGQFNIWQNVPKKKATSAMVGPTIPSTKKEKPERVMAHLAIAVENGYLFIASNVDYLRQLLSAPTQCLKDNANYQKTMAELKKCNGNSAAIWVYCPTDIDNRYTYEQYRQGKISTSKSFVGRIVKSINGANNANPLQFDGRTLPPYEFSKPYFGPCGVYFKADNTGFFYEGFVLPTTTK